MTGDSPDHIQMWPQTTTIAKMLMKLTKTLDSASTSDRIKITGGPFLLYSNRNPILFV